VIPTEQKQVSSRVITSPWPFVVVSIALTIATHFLFSLYGTIHWQIWVPSAAVSSLTDSLAANEVAAENQKRILLMKESSAKISKASGRLLGTLEIHRLLGLGSAVSVLMAIQRRPRWAGLIALPFALYAVVLSVIFV
jgi:hypothetical protein